MNMNILKNEIMKVTAEISKIDVLKFLALGDTSEENYNKILDEIEKRDGTIELDMSIMKEVNPETALAFASLVVIQIAYDLDIKLD